MSGSRYLTARAWTFGLCVSIALLGCASPSRLATQGPVHAPQADTNVAPAARSGRYTLVEIAPKEAQRDLMRQVIEVRAPQALPATVADMLRYVLLRSGYSVCGGEALQHFETLPLPAAHFELGPITLTDALVVLAGPAWHLRVDEATRQVCFASAGPRAAGESESRP